MDALIFNSILAIVVFIIGLFYLQGLFHKSQNEKRIIKSTIDWDKIIFPKLDDKILTKKADKFAFLLCFIMAILIILNGLAHYFWRLSNISMIFVIFAIFGTWLARIIFIYFLIKKIGIKKK